ncbi:MAG: sigma-70 family RNA polymerase sigma factor [Planctomycetota bacterium]
MAVQLLDKNCARTAVTDGTAELDDAILVTRTRAGDERAFEELVRRYTPKVWSLVTGMIRDRDACEDVVQDVFFKVHTKLDLFEGKSRFFTWVYRIAFNTATDWLKKKRTDRSIETEDFTLFEVEAPGDAPDAGLRENELEGRLAAAVAELPEKYRDILVLREYERLSYDEIAEVRSCSPGTVESRLFRARARLKDKLKGLLF